MNTRHGYRLRLLSAAACATFAAGLISGCGSEPGDETIASSSSQRGDAESVTTDGHAMPPWPAPVADVPDRVAAAGLDLGPMGTAEHYHPKLQIIIDGQQIQVPANIGVDPPPAPCPRCTRTRRTAPSTSRLTPSGRPSHSGNCSRSGRHANPDPDRRGTHRQRRPAAHQQWHARGGDPADLRLEPEQRIVLKVR